MADKKLNVDNVDETDLTAPIEDVVEDVAIVDETVSVEVPAEAAKVAPRGGRGGQRGQQGRGRGGQRQQRDRGDAEKDPNSFEKVVFINRCAKVVKGGRRFSFSALVVAGNCSGNVGIGFGKANEVSEAIRKGTEGARKRMSTVAVEKHTIPHEVIGEFGGGRVMLKPASPGTGLVAGGGVRAVLEAAGIKDVLAKSMGSSNPSNVAKATLCALEKLRNRDVIMSSRGKRQKEKVS